MMANYLVTDEQLTATADAIREKTGGTDLLTWDESKGFADVVSEIEAGGGGNEILDALIDRSITAIKSNLDVIGNYAFRECTKLTSVDMPLLTRIGSNAFYYCKSLTSVNMPLLTSIGNYAFDSCINLTSVNFPLITNIVAYEFQGCTSLTSVDMPLLTRIGVRSFGGCKQLTKLILRSETICTISNISAFSNTPFAAGGTGGTVYVPSALITEYQNATNWSTLYAGGTCTFLPIEGSEYE